MSIGRPPLEVWNSSFSIPRWTARQGVIVEELGFDGITVSDSQNLSSDPYVTMMAVAAATSTLKVAPSVTNPVTRDAAITACAIASVQAESKGRAVLGIGRGDSALAHLGLAPASVKRFEDYLSRVQGYLRGEDVPFERSAHLQAGVRDVETLGLVNAPTSSVMSWIRTDLPKVPVYATATGPKVIDAAARTADGINFAVGVDPTRVKWAIDRARSARAAADLDPDTLSLGLYVSVVPESDQSKARRLISGDVASFARFSVMHGEAVGNVSEESKRVLQDIHSTYDMNGHFRDTSPQAQVLTDEFIDSYAVTGEPRRCLDQIAELLDLGIDRLLVSTSVRGSDRASADEYRTIFAGEILPGLRDLRRP
ncbi:LLM class flavin-dependent oxidoreductase [Nocardia vaccinii]|uniref:LLM class flavin-dependent oxidoreductase n=1 Tax=Nocardia vaccinii TaxID=1822 RepID=UPI000AC09CF4|nr:LLM class flavin-dependent oxidoreductase [Nocardia vaccinii]